MKKLITLIAGLLLVALPVGLAGCDEDGLVCRAVGYDERQQFFRCYRGRCREILTGA